LSKRFDLKVKHILNKQYDVICHFVTYLSIVTIIIQKKERESTLFSFQEFEDSLTTSLEVAAEGPEPAATAAEVCFPDSEPEDPEPDVNPVLDPTEFWEFSDKFRSKRKTFSNF
jgi:hypothetical protein